MNSDVRKGASVLDKMCPGWFDRIDVDRIDMTSWDDCILGQLYGVFHTGLRELDLHDASLFGFICGSTWDCTCHELKDPWIVEIMDRRNSRPE